MLRLSTDRRLTFGFLSFTVTGSHSTVSSIVSMIIFMTQFNFFLLTLGLDICVELVSVLADPDPSESLQFSSDKRLVLSIISSGIDSFTLRFCQNIWYDEWWRKKL